MRFRWILWIFDITFDEGIPDWEERMREDTSTSEARCIVLTPKEGVDAACRIIQRLELKAHIEHCPLLALSELVLMHQLNRNDAAWNAAPKPTVLILINTDAIEGVADLQRALAHYLPDVEISTLKDGQIQSVKDQSHLVDNLEEPPIIHAESVDPDELSMLLDSTELGTEE
ncbi:MAG: hypothetical protein QGI78_04290 [Phycisphaerales bacterium]|jgi:hypothetical protein|nr:hypothetical protein [Phycisphaerales bacterium]